MATSSKEFSKRFTFITDYIAPDEVEFLMQHMEVKQVDKNEGIIKDGAPSAVLYFVWSGFLLSYIEENSKIIEIGVITPGQYIGEISFFDEGDATTSVKALESCTLFTLSRENFAKLELNYPTISSKLMRSISSQIISRLRSSDRLLFDSLNDESAEATEKTETANTRAWINDVFASLHRN